MSDMPQRIFPAARSSVDIPRSPVIAGIAWLGEQISYSDAAVHGDTFPVTWASDDQLYTSAGDPLWGAKDDGLDVERFSGMPPHFTITKINEMMEFRGWGGSGPKPTGMLCVNNVLYLAIQNLTGKGDSETNDAVNPYGHGYDAHILASSDWGATWTSASPAPMFPGRRFGAPAFVNFGKNHAGARDRFVYVISGEGWDNGSFCRLARVPQDAILERASWEWVGGWTEADQPRWTPSLEEAVPILTHPGYLGTVEMVYLAPLRRYLLFSWHHKVKSGPGMGSELIIYDAPEPWGPFTLVHHEDPWETPVMNPYNPRFPLKWFDPDRLIGWLLFSGSWSSPEPHYKAHVRQLRFRLQPDR